METLPTSLGNLCQCSLTLMVKVFPDVQTDPHVLWFVPIASALLLMHFVILRTATFNKYAVYFLIFFVQL